MQCVTVITFYGRPIGVRWSITIIGTPIIIIIVAQRLACTAMFHCDCILRSTHRGMKFLQHGVAEALRENHLCAKDVWYRPWWRNFIPLWVDHKMQRATLRCYLSLVDIFNVFLSTVKQEVAFEASAMPSSWACQSNLMMNFNTFEIWNGAFNTFLLGMCPYELWSHWGSVGSIHFLYIYDWYGPWSQQGLGGSMVKKNHTPVGRPLNATSNFDMLFEYEKYI